MITSRQEIDDKPRQCAEKQTKVCKVKATVSPVVGHEW